MKRRFMEGRIDIWHKLAYYKYVFLKQSKVVKQISFYRGAKLDEEKMFWCIQYLRAVNSEKWEEAKISTVAFPGLLMEAYIL